MPIAFRAVRHATSRVCLFVYSLLLPSAGGPRRSRAAARQRLHRWRATRFRPTWPVDLEVMIGGLP